MVAAGIRPRVSLALAAATLVVGLGIGWWLGSDAEKGPLREEIDAQRQREEDAKARNSETERELRALDRDIGIR